MIGRETNSQNETLLSSLTRFSWQRLARILECGELTPFIKSWEILRAGAGGGGGGGAGRCVPGLKTNKVNDGIEVRVSPSSIRGGSRKSNECDSKMTVRLNV